MKIIIHSIIFYKFLRIKDFERNNAITFIHPKGESKTLENFNKNNKVQKTRIILYRIKIATEQFFRNQKWKLKKPEFLYLITYDFYFTLPFLG